MTDKAQALREAFLAAVAAEDYAEADRIEAELVALTGKRVPPSEVPAPAVQTWPPTTTTERAEQE